MRRVKKFDQYWEAIIDSDQNIYNFYLKVTSPQGEETTKNDKGTKEELFSSIRENIDRDDLDQLSQNEKAEKVFTAEIEFQFRKGRKGENVEEYQYIPFQITISKNLNNTDVDEWDLQQYKVDREESGKQSGQVTIDSLFERMNMSFDEINNIEREGPIDALNKKENEEQQLEKNANKEKEKKESGNPEEQ